MRRLDARWLCAALVLCPALAWANTRFGFGTITAVDPEGKQSAVKGAASFQVRYEFRNLAARAVWHTEWYRFSERTRHGDRVYFLDGQPSTAEEAVKAGRAVAMTANDMVCFISSKVPGPQTADAAGTADDAVYRIVLAGAFNGEAPEYEKKAVTGAKPVTSAVEVLLDCRGGALAAGAAVVPGLYFPDFDLDLTGLKRNGAALEGTAAFAVEFPADKERAARRMACSYTLKVSSDDKGGVSGTFEGKCGEKAVSGKVSGERMARGALPAPLRVWLALDQLADGHLCYVVAEFQDGQAQPGGRVLFSKGHRIGAVTAQDLKLGGERLSGRFEGQMQEGGKGTPFQVTLDGAVFGNRLVFGTYQLTAEGGTAVKGRLRGGLCDARGPQIEGPTPEQDRQVKEMQAKMTEKK